MNRSKTMLLLMCIVINLLLVIPVQANTQDAQAKMTMHHMHVMINHAVEMATEGSNLIMLGHMNMASGVDNISVKHGQKMIAHAKGLIKEMLEGDTMQKLHAQGAKGANMQHTHQLAEAAKAYINLIDTMPYDSGHKH